MKDLAIIGAGGFGKEVKTLVDHINQHRLIWNLLGFYDDHLVEEVSNLPVLGTIDDLINQSRRPFLVIAIGNSRARRQIAGKLKSSGPKFATLIHPTVVIGDKKGVDISPGSIITAGVILTTDIEIGEHVIINLNATIGHDARIGNYSSIMPGANVAGNVNLKDGVFIGSGVNILGGVCLGEFCTIGAGAVVTNDIAANTVAVGVPARERKDA